MKTIVTLLLMLAPLMASQANCADKKWELISQAPFENGDCSFCDVKPELPKRNGCTTANGQRRECTPKDIQRNLKNLFDIPFTPRTETNWQHRKCTPEDIQGNLKSLFDIPFTPRAETNWQHRKCTPEDIRGNLKNLFDIPFTPRTVANRQRRESSIINH